MKVNKILKKLETRVDNLYDTLYSIRDIFDDIEDEEIDFIVNGFIEQVELSIAEGSICVTDIQEQIKDIAEKELI